MAWKKWRGTPTRGRFHAYWTETVGGKQIKRSRALSRDEAVADRMLGEIERNLELKGIGLGQVVLLARLREDYLRFLKADGCTKSYLDRVGIILTHLERIFPGVRLPEITPQLLDTYKLRRREAQIDPATINRELGVIKAAVRRARRWQYQVNDLADVSNVKAIEKPRPPFTNDEIKTMTAKADRIFQLVAALGLYAGLRRMEILQLCWRTVDFKEKKLTLGDGWKTKTGQIRSVPLHPRLEALLRARKGRKGIQERVVPWEGSPHSLSMKFRYFLRRKCLVDHGTLHSLRHTFLTELKRHDMDTGKIQRVAGHKDQKTTDSYIHLNVNDLRQGVKRVNYD